MRIAWPAEAGIYDEGLFGMLRMPLIRRIASGTP